jgi:uncharacterized membrane protein
MGNELADLMSRATNQLPVEAGIAERVIESFHRRRRHRFIGMVVAVLVCAAGVAVPLATLSSDRTDISRIVPAAPSSASPSDGPLAEVAGVGVTYLPSGLFPSSNLVLNAMVKENGHSSVSQYYQSVGPTTDDGPAMSIAVQRGYTADLEAFARSSKGSVESWVVVRGHRALLQSAPPGTGESYELTWVESPGLTLTLFSSGGVSRADFDRVASGLVISHEALTPADPAAATTSIRQTIQQAFTGGQPPATTLGAVQNGSQLSSALAQFTQGNAQLARSIHATAVTVTFTAADEAIASVSLGYEATQPDGQLGAGPPLQAEVTVDYTGGRWLIAKDSYCSQLKAAVQSLSC